MNKWLYFLCGFAIGAIGGVAGYDLYLKKMAKDNDISEEYQRLADEYSDTEVNPVNDYNEYMNDMVRDPMSDEELDDIKEKLKENYEKTTNYASMYQGDAANYEHPLDDEEDEDEDSVYTEEDEVYDEIVDHQKTKNMKPKIISVEAVGDLPPRIDMQTLLYYQDNDILTTEEDEEIDNIEFLIGDSLTKYGFKDNDEDRIFVLNYATDTCYDVQKVQGAYTP